MMMNKIRFVEEESFDTASETIQERKKKLRAYMKERRGQNENRDVKERLLIDNFLHWLSCERKGECTGLKVFIYLSFSSEAPTDTLIERLKEMDCKIYCPHIEKDKMTAVLHSEDFCLSDYGIREPIGEPIDETTGQEMDIIVLPLLAVDKKGGRLGYGKGYYDRYLKAYPKAKRVAYCYDFQVCNEVPTEDFDEKVDVIITDKNVLYIDNIER